MKVKNVQNYLVGQGWSRKTCLTEAADLEHTRASCPQSRRKLHMVKSSDSATNMKEKKKTRERMNAPRMCLIFDSHGSTFHL